MWACHQQDLSLWRTSISCVGAAGNCTAIVAGDSLPCGYGFAGVLPATRCPGHSGLSMRELQRRKPDSLFHRFDRVLLSFIRTSPYPRSWPRPRGTDHQTGSCAHRARSGFPDQLDRLLLQSRVSYCKHTTLIKADEKLWGDHIMFLCIRL